MDKFTRRNFLFGLSKFGITTGLIDCFFDQIIFGRISKLLANTQTDKFYFGMYLPFAPSQWLFYGPLEEGPTDNAYVGNALENVDGLWQPKYSTNTDGLPILWNQFSDIKDHTAFVTGVKALPIHAQKFQQFTPRSGVPGIHAIASMNDSTYPVACVQWGMMANLNHQSSRSSLNIARDLSGLTSKADGDQAEKILRQALLPFHSSKVKNLNSNLKRK